MARTKPTPTVIRSALSGSLVLAGATFSMQALAGGYQQDTSPPATGESQPRKAEEGKCGQGKCGAATAKPSSTSATAAGLAPKPQPRVQGDAAASGQASDQPNEPAKPSS